MASKLNIVEERINQLEGKSIETPQTDVQKQKKNKKLKESQRIMGDKAVARTSENREKGCSRGSILNNNSQRLPKINSKHQTLASVLRAHKGGEARGTESSAFRHIVLKRKKNKILKETGGGHINY